MGWFPTPCVIMPNPRFSRGHWVSLCGCQCFVQHYCCFVLFLGRVTICGYIKYGVCMCVGVHVFLLCFKTPFSASEVIFGFRTGGRAREMWFVCLHYLGTTWLAVSWGKLYNLIADLYLNVEESLRGTWHLHCKNSDNTDLRSLEFKVFTYWCFPALVQVI